jgi:hypothetical protein
VLTGQIGGVASFLASVPEERAGFRYAPEKWSIREVVGHVIDCERVFGYRALSLARGETQSLPGFDETVYAARAGHDRFTLSSLVEEFQCLRQSHLHMFRRLSDTAWLTKGTANGHPTSVRGLAYVIAGHLRHHMSILTSRYGVPGNAI